MKVHGYDAKHFLNSAATMVDESMDDGLCPTEQDRARYVALAQIDAMIGLALTIADAAETGVVVSAEAQPE